MQLHIAPQRCGQVAEWLKAADCKSARFSVRWFESSPATNCPFRDENGGFPEFNFQYVI